MRRGLTWAMVSSVALSAAALWNDAPIRVVSAVEPRLRDHAQALDEVASGPARGQSPSLSTLPLALDALTLEPAKRDLFGTAAPIAEPAPVAPAKPPPAAVVPNTPEASPVQLRYLGTMLDPNGKRLVYLARGDTAVLVGDGDRLDEGYVVESLKPDAIVLVMPALSTRVTIPIPPTPQQ